jgi:hypothetical protein
MFSLDLDRQRREFMRWVLLLALYNGRPVETWEGVLISTMQGVYADATKREVRVELDYLEERGLVKIKRAPDGRWFAELSRAGVDFMEYNVDAEPGIARPPKLG